MLHALEAGTVERLMAAIDAGDRAMIRHFSRKVLQRAFAHLAHTEVPLSGDGMGMSALLVAASEFENSLPFLHK
jgi:hypothetical protein